MSRDHARHHEREREREESLAVAMALAPGVYARNRMFDFFARRFVRRAKARAAILRGLVQELGRAANVSLTGGSATTGDEHHVLRYAIPELRMTRVVELTRTELAALRVLAARAGLPCLPMDDGDRARVDAALARLLDEDGGPALVRAAAAADAAAEPT